MPGGNEHEQLSSRAHKHEFSAVWKPANVELTTQVFGADKEIYDFFFFLFLPPPPPLPPLTSQYFLPELQIYSTRGDNRGNRPRSSPLPWEWKAEA